MHENRNLLGRQVRHGDSTKFERGFARGNIICLVNLFLKVSKWFVHITSISYKEVFTYYRLQRSTHKLKELVKQSEKQ